MPTDRRRPRKLAAAPSYQALPLSQNSHRFFFTTVPVEDLFPCCFVARRDEDPELGFQRALNADRAQDIAAYLSAGSGSIPTNVVLSAQPEALLDYKRKTKTLSFERVKNAFLVLDGQHRLWGYHKCPKKHRVPVAIYQGLTRAEEAKLFVDINTNQRGVPAALLLDIKKLAAIEEAHETRLRELFDQLAKDPVSPLAGKLSASKSVARKISRVAFNRAVGPALSGAALAELTHPAQYRLLVSYIRAFDAELTDKKQLIAAAFFEAMFAVFDEAVRAAIASKGNAKQEAIQEAIRPAAKVDYAALSGKKKVVSAMQAALRKGMSVSEDMV